MQMLGTWLVAFQDIRPGGGRNPIGRRTESDRAADGIRSGGGRNPIGQRTQTVDLRRCSFRGCTLIRYIFSSSCCRQKRSPSAKPSS